MNVNKMKYNEMSVAELRAVARRDGIYEYDKMSKAELLRELYDFDLYCGVYCTVAELRADARSRGLSGYSEMCKAELIELLENDHYNNYERYLMGFQGDDDDDDDDDDSIGSLIEVWKMKDKDEEEEEEEEVDSDFEDNDEEDLIFL